MTFRMTDLQVKPESLLVYGVCTGFWFSFKTATLFFIIIHSLLNVND